MKKENPENIRRRQSAYAERQRAAGMAKVTVWVPLDRAADLREIARKMVNAPSRREIG